MAIVGELAQTFFIDSEAVNKATHTFLSSIDLYFKNKPVAGSSSSNLPRPGVTIFICETKNNNNLAVPDLDKPIKYGRARLEYSSINTSTDGSALTTFSFNVPVPVKTNTPYAIIIKFDGADTGFSLWRNKANEVYNLVKKPAITKGALDGYFFVLTNGVNAAPQPDVDLKFALKVWKFTTANTTYSVVNRNYEFLCINMPTKTGNAFVPGELVYANTGYPSAQTVSVSATSNTITGTGTTFLTNFSNGSYIVLNSGTKNEVRRVTSISNNTTMKVDFVPSFTNASSKYLVAPVGLVFDYKPENGILTLVASSANSTVNFIANSTSNTVHGVTSNASVSVAGLLNFPINEYITRFGTVTPSGTAVNTYIRFANSSGNTVSTPYKADNFKSKTFTDFKSYLYSRSDEAAFGSGLTNEKSVNFNLEFSTSNQFVTPFIDEEDLNFFGYRYGINNDITNEHTNNGSAVCKYISKRISLASGQEAEDMRVYLTAYRPFNTDVHVYVKFYNELDPESFSSKNWTKLENIVTQNLFSAQENPKDFVELEFKVPNYPLFDDVEQGVIRSGTVLTSTFKGSDANNVFVAANTSANIENQIANTDLVRVYDPLFPNNSLIAVVTSSNSTTFTIDTSLNSSNTRLSGFINSGLAAEKIEFKNTAFNNHLGNTVIKYYNSAMSAFDTYNSFAYKIILTADYNSTVTPTVDNIRGIALSA